MRFTSIALVLASAIAVNAAAIAQDASFDLAARSEMPEDYAELDVRSADETAEPKLAKRIFWFHTWRKHRAEKKAHAQGQQQGEKQGKQEAQQQQGQQGQQDQGQQGQGQQGQGQQGQSQGNEKRSVEMMAEAAEPQLEKRVWSFGHKKQTQWNEGGRFTLHRAQPLQGHP